MGLHCALPSFAPLLARTAAMCRATRSCRYCRKSLPQLPAISVKKVMHDYCIYCFFLREIFSSRVIGVENAELSEVVSAVHTTRNI